MCVLVVSVHAPVVWRWVCGFSGVSPHSLECGFVRVALWWCANKSIFICVGFWCVCVWMRGGGSLVSLLNIKQLEVIKYLGSTGSLWILILPFPSVSQISLFFSMFLFPFFSSKFSSSTPNSPSLSSSLLRRHFPWLILSPAHALILFNSMI